MLLRINTIHNNFKVMTAETEEIIEILCNPSYCYFYRPSDQDKIKEAINTLMYKYSIPLTFDEINEAFTKVRCGTKYVNRFIVLRIKMLLSVSLKDHPELFTALLLCIKKGHSLMEFLELLIDKPDGSGKIIGYPDDQNLGGYRLWQYKILLNNYKFDIENLNLKEEQKQILRDFIALKYPCYRVKPAVKK